MIYIRFGVGECDHTFNNDDDANLPLSQEEPLRAVHVVYLPGAAAAARVRVAIIARVPKKEQNRGPPFPSKFDARFKRKDQI